MKRGPSFVVDEPQRCVEEQPSTDPGGQSDEWVPALGNLVDERLRNTTCATSALDGRVAFAMDFDRDGNPTRTSVAASTLTDCSVVECLKSALEPLVAPPRRLIAARRGTSRPSR